MDFSGVLASVSTGKADFACCGIAYTPERAESVLFSETYYESKTVREPDDDGKEEADKASKNIMERFFRNLLLDEQWDLRNRYLHIHAPKEWSVQPNLVDPTSTRTTTRTSSLVSSLNPNSKFFTDNEIIIELVRIVGNDELSVKQMMELAGLKHRQNFLEYHPMPPGR